LTGVGDIGGFGVSSDFAWELMGTVNYRINDRTSVSVGYRYYDVDYKDDGFVFDAAQYGPIIGSSFRF
jgi:opacity protein-like surface antigen